MAQGSTIDNPRRVRRPLRERTFVVNDELRMTNDERSPKSECQNPGSLDSLRTLDFVTASSLDIRHWTPYLSISPITISNEPTMAGTSASNTPRHNSPVTDKLQKQLLRARVRQGIEVPSLTR